MVINSVLVGKLKIVMQNQLSDIFKNCSVTSADLKAFDQLYIYIYIVSFKRV